MARVAVVKGSRVSAMTRKAFDLLDAANVIRPTDTVLLKPNYIVAKPPSTGVTTDSRVVEGIIEWLRGRGVKDIVVGEGGAGDTEKAFDVVGIRDVAARHGVRLVNLNKDRRVTVRLPDALALREIGVAKTVLERTCIVNVPSLKVHHLALVTLSMKNLMGMMLPKSIMHSRIHHKIVDLAAFFRGKVAMNVVDGVVGSELHEVDGRPVRMDLLIAGRDMVAVDAVATTIMGLDPSDVPYLRLADERGLGSSDIDQIEVVGEPLEDVQRRFSRSRRSGPLRGLFRRITKT
jgi:uncharacterized protein (DUF362 family)